jgi:ABC-type transport system involved in multi-copper enzyme maturation permease subunit
MAYVLGLTGLAALVTMIVAATPVTSEKESRTWPMLLATTLGPWQILLGKAAGVFRRVTPVWLLLIGHVLLFTLVGYMHPILSLHLAMLVTYTVVFLTATGLYLGARFKRTTTAVVMNIVVAVVVWGILPWVAPMGLAFLRREPPPDAVVTVSVELNPVVQSIVVSERGCGESRARGRLARKRYHWLSGKRSWQESTVVVWVAMTLHFAAAGVLLWRAGVRMRQKIF